MSQPVNMVRCGNKIHGDVRTYHNGTTAVRECYSHYPIRPAAPVQPAPRRTIWSLPIARWAWEGDARGRG